MTSKVCNKCGKNEDEIEFEKHRRVCKECRTKQKLERIEESRMRYYEVLKDSKCSFCPEDNPLVLQFHHRGDKSDGISEMINKGVSWKKIEKEMSKCQLLCANCHSIVTVFEAKSNKLANFWEYIPDGLIEISL